MSEGIERSPRGKNIEAWEAAKTIPRGEIIEQLAAPLSKVLHEIAPQLKAGAYAVVLGDDVAGRIPTLIVGDVAARLAREPGKAKPEIRFIAGSTNLTEEQLQKKREKLAVYFTDLRNEFLNGKLLFVTDTINAGDTVIATMEAARKAGWECEVLSVGRTPHAEIDRIQKMAGAPIHVGQDTVPNVFYRRELAGVHKQATDIHATPNEHVSQEIVNEVRRAAHAVAGRIAAEEFPSENTE